ncbi:hypothetical protein LTR37_017013 [Vermiconidia calcicola]|uniref:Uncharacterized protein n=1 Tax=Vermiconidia calcicola TaxID=1690605 RepID=A0ACC3MME8_9PEZI|nr:hypothetical protein LTR37_017013 [Vermiconidia calcicola]
MQPGMVVRPGSEGEEEFHSLSSPGHSLEEESEDDMQSEEMDAPVHPVQSMQGAFEESIVESTEENNGQSALKGAHAEARRQDLLESKRYDDSWRARWNQSPTAEHHPLIKLVSQIVFGMHLLQQQQAKSEGEVVKILQSHVNEVDGFLERTAEDFTLAINDIDERITHLKLPMTHRDVFEIMLDDKQFRTQLLDGNEKIERIIDRTTKAMKASLYDIQNGKEANKELGRYLDGVQDQWPKEKRAITDVFGAMRGNQQGWTRYMNDLQAKADSLKKNLRKLSTVLGEISQLAASRTTKAQSKPASSGSKSAPSSPRSKFSDQPTPAVPSPPSSVLNKPLPKEPQPVEGISHDVTKAHPVPLSERYERPRQLPQFPERSVSKATTKSSGEAQRPKTAGHLTAAREARQARAADERTTADLASFLRDGPPQKSSVPQNRQPRAADARGETLDLASFLKDDGAPPPRSKPKQTIQPREADARNDTLDLASFLKDSGPPQRSNPHDNPLRSNPPETTSCLPVKPEPGKRFGSFSRSQSQGTNLLINGASALGSNFTPSRSKSSGAVDILEFAGVARKQSVGQMKVDDSTRASAEQGPGRAGTDSSSFEKGETNSSPFPTGFARRLSKRMKHLPAQEEAAAEQTENSEKTDLPPDSAYSSGTDGKLSVANSKNRPESFLGPLPTKTMEPLYSSRVSSEQQNTISDGQSVRSLAPTEKSKGASIKDIFARRWGSNKKVATTT